MNEASFACLKCSEGMYGALPEFEISWTLRIEGIGLTGMPLEKHGIFVSQRLGVGGSAGISKLDSPRGVTLGNEIGRLIVDETSGDANARSNSRYKESGFMRQIHRLTGIIEKEDDGFVALCPELDIASEGTTLAEARANLIEAIELFFETASPSEVEGRLHTEIYVTPIEVSVG